MSRAIEWFARNPVAANLLMFMVIAAGVAALPVIQQRTYPDLPINAINISMEYRGASPKEVEEGVCVRIEEEIAAVDGIERLQSVASEGACRLFVEIVDGYPLDRAHVEIKNKVDGIDTFPELTEQPVVDQFTVRRNAIQLVLSGAADERALRLHGERIRDEIAALPGVTQVELAGVRRYEIAIEVPEDSLRRFGLTFDDVVGAVRRSSLDLPGGAIKAERGEILLRAKGQAYTARDFEEIVVLTRDDGTRLLLGDVATVVDGFEEVGRYALFDGAPAVVIQAFRVGEQKVLEVVAEVLTWLDGAEARLPEGLDLTVWKNESDYLRDRLNMLVRNGFSGFVLVFLLLALFLRLRLAFWVAISVPISIMGSLALFPVMDVSIDVLSLFAFILVLGILVDNAIVVGENIHTHQERGEEPVEAAVTGAQEVTVPVNFGVLTTIAAFLPLLISAGGMGNFFQTIGIVVTCCLLFSLIEAQWVLPAHLAYHAGQVRAGTGAAGRGVSRRFKALQNAASESLTRLASERYAPALDRAMEWRYATVAVATGLLAVSVSLIASGRMAFTFFPEIQSDFVTATVEMPPGTPAERTQAAVRILQASVAATQAEVEKKYGTPDRPVTRHAMVAFGEHLSMNNNASPGGGAKVGDEYGSVALELTSGRRPISTDAVARIWRSRTPEIAGAEEVRFETSLVNAGDPIDIELRSSNIDHLEQAAGTLAEHLASFPGVYGIADSFQSGKFEIELAILPSAEALGLTLSDLARQVRQAFYGEEAQRVQRGRDDVRVMVRYPESQRRAVEDLDNLRIRTPAGGEVPFYAVAEAKPGRGFSSILRTDRQRVVEVTADVDTTVANANNLLTELQRGFLPELEARYPGLSYSLEGEAREQAETVGAMARNYVLALFLIFALLAVPLRSYLQPLLIMGVIPFGLVGAIAGHLLLGYSFSMMSVFGIVALSGVVVNASLVLIHNVNARQGEGLVLVDAIRAAGVSRFRPIVLTSLTTFVGLVPLLREPSTGAQLVIPMGVSLGFGVLFATFVTLFVLPSGLMILDDLDTRLRRRKPAAPALAEVGRLRSTG